jgi:hypothetical protein
MLNIGDYASEERFFEALSGEYPKPYWLVSVEQASPLLDIRGVDAIAQVKYPAKGGVVRVPIQIKHSWTSVAHYYTKHPYARQMRVVVLVIHLGHALHRVRSTLYDAVEEVRTANVRYDTFLDDLQKAPVTGKAVELLKMMEAKRGMSQPQHAVAAE